MRRSLWFPGAERIPGIHEAGLAMDRTGGHFMTHHITAGGDYEGDKALLLRERYEPTLLLCALTGRRGQYLPANRGAFAMEHIGPTTNTEGNVQIQIEWVWPSMDKDITRAPHFAELWRDVVDFADAWGVPRTWPFGFKSEAKTLSKWRTSGHRGHVNAPGNSHSDNLPAPTRPAWPR